MNELKTIEYRGCKIRICYDQDPSSPREWDNVGTMVCWHRRYKLGDEQPSQDAEDYLLHLAYEAGSKAFQALLDRWQSTGDSALGDRVRAQRDAILERGYVILPLYLYDHSGITMSTGRFSCPWDSGQVGFIYASLETAKKNWPGTKSWKSKVRFKTSTDDKTVTLRDAVTRCLEGEVKVYDDFLTGSVFGWVAETPEGEHIDSCWGYYGYDETKEDGYMVKDCAQPAIDSWCGKQAEETDERAYWEARGTVTAD